LDADVVVYFFTSDRLLLGEEMTAREAVLLRFGGRLDDRWCQIPLSLESPGSEFAGKKIGAVI
jgi:hypothetical protein